MAANADMTTNGQTGRNLKLRGTLSSTNPVTCYKPTWQAVSDGCLHLLQDLMTCHCAMICRPAPAQSQPTARAPEADHSDVLGRMQALTLYPGEVPKSQPAAAAGDAETTEYDYSRDTSAQPSNAWFNHDQGYHDGYYHGYSNGQEYYDPNDYQYEYGTYDEENAEGADYTWEEHGEHSHDENLPDSFDRHAARVHDGGAESSAGLCSQFLASGQCSKGTKCRLAHGNLCEVDH